MRRIWRNSLINASDVDNELTVKVVVELLTGLNGDVGLASASSVPLIKISGIPVTLVAGRAAPVVETMPE